MQNRLLFFILPLYVFFSLSFLALAQDSIELRFLCFEDKNECTVYADLLAQFSAENPAITVSLEVEAEADMQDRLRAGIEAGAPPDIARIADFDALAGHYLDLGAWLSEPAALAADFRAPYFAALRGHDNEDEGLYGYPDAADIVAPFVNVSAFETAGVELPAAGATWTDWLAALNLVAERADIAYALAVDNKDHRLVGPAMSLGASYFDAQGNFDLSEANLSGLRVFSQQLKDLMDAGKTPTDTLLGTGKSQAYFVAGETVMYICGNWKAESVAEEVGDSFDWAIVPNPACAGGGTGVAQATALVAFAATEQPAAVAQVFLSICCKRRSTPHFPPAR